ncbi:MAG: hypothetical protein O3B32_02655 [Cyanobacteria bacterium]|nr:hypothetical protein [Cyanobacteriota bacterium]
MGNLQGSLGFTHRGTEGINAFEDGQGLPGLDAISLLNQDFTDGIVDQRAWNGDLADASEGLNAPDGGNLSGQERQLRLGRILGTVTPGQNPTRQ